MSNELHDMLIACHSLEYELWGRARRGVLPCSSYLGKQRWLEPDVQISVLIQYPWGQEP